MIRAPAGQLQYFRSPVDGRLHPYAVCATDTDPEPKPLLIEVSPGAMSDLPGAVALTEEMAAIAAEAGRSWRGPAAHGARTRHRLPELRRGRCPRGDRACRRPPRHRPGAHQYHRRLHGRRRRLVPGLPLPRPLRGGGALLRLLRLPPLGEARGTRLPHAAVGGGVVAVALGGLPGGQPAAHAAVDRPRGVGPGRGGRRARGALAPDGGAAGGEGVPPHLHRGARHRP